MDRLVLPSRTPPARTASDDPESLMHDSYAPADDDDDDDARSDYSSSSSVGEDLHKPLQPFQIEDGTPKLEKRKRWWDSMAVRARRKHEMDACKGAGSEGLLAGSLRRRRSARRTGGWCYNYCVFGGVSGLTVMAFLLLLNLVLGFATLLWSPDTDRVLRNWGRPGSGTEDLAWYPTDFLRDVTPIPCHSHNDYWRRVPLFSALRAGCTGVEADVWLFDDELYVGHNTASLTRNRTFQSLYVNPLVEILEAQNPQTDFYNGTGHGVFDTDPGKSLTLLVDVKTGGAETWPWVLAQLEPLRSRGWLSFVRDDVLHARPITVVGTGNTPFDVLTGNQTYRDAFFDAPLDQLGEASGESIAVDLEDQPPSPPTSPTVVITAGTTPPPTKNLGQGLSGVLPTSEFNATNSYYASVSFTQAVGRLWRGRISPGQLATIRAHVRGAHDRGLRARYWDLPAWPLGLRNHVWEVLVREGVDILNVDDLRAASRQVW